MAPLKVSFSDSRILAPAFLDFLLFDFLSGRLFTYSRPGPAGAALSGREIKAGGLDLGDGPRSRWMEGEDEPRAAGYHS